LGGGQKRCIGFATLRNRPATRKTEAIFEIDQSKHSV
jgi:hypothetical protein